MIPHVDVDTCEIHGCEKGSWKWYHEEGHIKFNTEHSGILMLKSYVFDAWMLFIMVAILYKPLFSIAVALWGGYTFITLLEEYWCNQYANSFYYN